ncbi:nitrilase-related carbon-nitrogen hydrolase [Methanoregula sp.]|uniref:nitrilase-related carbon-nitrogen hydrolase n=1 Tax=Methanoregula sp. TaxID=2052170 RepID=UPI00262B03A1|nr:nitrilase-related carbon-nitrogen hydrolase [Methanoregula sp.]MDD5144112.1 carbon-nitrogen hydrolase family protein [Methanoregula sp.]
MDDQQPVRICSAQIAGTWDNPATTLEKIRPLVHHAAVSGARLVCFPEQFATGWNPGSTNHAGELNGQLVSALREMAGENAIAILGSLREKSAGRLKNTALIIGDNGEILATYAKIHLFSPGGEDRQFSPGSELGIFRLGQLTCGLAICYDLRFPELFRIYARHGVQAMFVPAAWPASRRKHWELFVTARACENQMYVTGINTTGTTPVDSYSGGSMTVDPNGTTIAQANEAEQLLFCDLDPALVESVRTAFPVAKDCKSELYPLLSGRK